VPKEELEVKPWRSTHRALLLVPAAALATSTVWAQVWNPDPAIQAAVANATADSGAAFTYEVTALDKDTNVVPPPSQDYEECFVPDIWWGPPLLANPIINSGQFGDFVLHQSGPQTGEAWTAAVSAWTVDEDTMYSDKWGIADTANFGGPMGRNDTDVYLANVVTIRSVTGGIAGWVTDAHTAFAIEGAEVELVDSQRSVTTDWNGWYRMDFVWPGAHPAKAQAGMYHPMDPINVNVVRNFVTLQNFQLDFDEPEELHGFVYEAGTQTGISSIDIYIDNNLSASTGWDGAYSTMVGVGLLTVQARDPFGMYGDSGEDLVPIEEDEQVRHDFFLTMVPGWGQG